MNIPRSSQTVRRMLRPLAKQRSTAKKDPYAISKARLSHTSWIEKRAISVVKAIPDPAKATSIGSIAKKRSLALTGPARVTPQHVMGGARKGEDIPAPAATPAGPHGNPAIKPITDMTDVTNP